MFLGRFCWWLRNVFGMIVWWVFIMLGSCFMSLGSFWNHFGIILECVGDECLMFFWPDVDWPTSVNTCGKSVLNQFWDRFVTNCLTRFWTAQKREQFSKLHVLDVWIDFWLICWSDFGRFRQNRLVATTATATTTIAAAQLWGDYSLVATFESIAEHVVPVALCVCRWAYNSISPTGRNCTDPTPPN